ncbi:hypothetical protein GF108_08885 [Phyllobacterium sp. SYP-B3895]|uniref:helix-turn-helix transcriptional regulator n=1 Tax=Phyllobacterium sp. SYP-B3895 TaxID=2663240 RepID=UPI00129965AD|nr:hypothetical protein [Phyllobacterium sp. SYP-B3895]MRG55696.1 hypothetical protein [Phyllobacterium sp. SYP-B3895]
MDFHDDDDRILTPAEITALTSLSETSQWRGRKEGWFPPYLDLSPGRRGNTLGQIRRLMRERQAEAEARAKVGLDAKPRSRGRPKALTRLSN